MNITETEVILLIFAAFSFGLLLFLIYQNKVNKLKYSNTQNNIDLEFFVRNFNKIEDVLDVIQNSDNFKTLKENEYLKGKEEGRKEALKSIEILYEPYIEKEERWFSHKKIYGYSMQLSIHGLPIGERTICILGKVRKIKQKEVDDLKASIEKTINNLIDKVSGLGISAKKRVFKNL